MLSFIQPAVLRLFRTHPNSLSCVRKSSSVPCAAALRDTQSLAVAAAAAPVVPLLHSLRHSRVLVRESLADALQRCKSRIAIDATCGRGSDTLTLGALLGPKGKVHAIDVQYAAVAETRARYADAAAEPGARLAQLTVHCATHSDLHFLPVSDGDVAAVVYNLGWYPAPDADRTLVTLPTSTVDSLCEARRLLDLHGVVVITVYPGHPGGREEADAVKEWVSKLDPRAWSCTYVEYPNRHAAPCVHICERVK